MLVTDLTVEVRDSSLARVGQILPADLLGAQFVLRFNNVGSWRILLAADHSLADALRAEGAGIIVTGPDGVLLSGPTKTARLTKSADDPSGVWEIIGSDDGEYLANRLAYPTPTTADVTAQTSDYDVRTGAAETVMKEYVDANIGPSAPVARSIPALTIEADAARGATATASARFDTLGALLTTLATPSGLGFTIEQEGADLVFKVYEPVDRSATIRMDVDNRRLEKSEYAYTAPKATRVIVAGQGSGADRTFLEVTSTEATAAETSWGRRIEVFKDQRNTNDAGELEQAGSEIITEGGKTVESVKVTPSDDQTMAYGVDWGLGDLVTVVVGSQEVVQTVTEVAIVVVEDGVKVGATVGNPKVAEATDPQSVTQAQTADQEQRISNLERNEPAAGGGGGTSANNVKHLVKNGSGATLPAGTVVYVTGADGTNILVGPADADTEATSSKTLGLLETELVANAQGYVITEGLLAGLDTSGATAGDSVWLSTTAGAFVYDAPPAEPAHSVYLGVVTRSQSSNGEIFVHVQNGFELDELHGVAITSPANGQVLGYNGSSWGNFFGGVPTGAITMWYTNTAPAGWQLCDGSAAATSALAAVVGANVPNLNGRVPVGRDASQTEFDTLGETGGAKTVTLTTAEMPAHTHTLSGSTASDTHSHTVPNRPTVSSGATNGPLFESWPGGSGTARTHNTSSDTHSHGVGTLANSSTGGGGAHNNLQPYIVLNYIIKT